MDSLAPVPPAQADDADAVTQWLVRLGHDPEAAEKTYALLYQPLRRLARSHLRREDDGHTLSATALVHEAWLRLSLQSRTQWRNRGHFMAIASTMMRRILVDHALARRAARRECAVDPELGQTLDELGSGPDADVVAVHDALLALQVHDERAAKVVELRFFGGFELDEVAEALGVSLATVKRDWALARAWLARELGVR